MLKGLSSDVFRDVLKSCSLLHSKASFWLRVSLSHNFWWFAHAKMNFLQKYVGDMKTWSWYSDSALKFASNGMYRYKIYIDLPDVKHGNDNCVGVTEKSSDINAKLISSYTNTYHSTPNLTLKSNFRLKSPRPRILVKVDFLWICVGSFTQCSYNLIKFRVFSRSVSVFSNDWSSF